MMLQPSDVWEPVPVSQDGAPIRHSSARDPEVQADLLRIQNLPGYT